MENLLVAQSYTPHVESECCIKETKVVRVAIYARVSTEEQAEHGFSIDAQLDTLRNYCKMQNKVVVGEYVDRGVSGKSIEGRYELQRLLNDAQKDEFDEVVVWKITRLARKTIDLLRIVEMLRKYNVTFRSFSENLENETAMGKFGLQMMGAVGELERNTIVDNVKMGMRQRARTGRWNGGRVLGYKSVITDVTGKRGNETKLVIVEEEAEIIHMIFELYANGKGLKAIANQLNHEGHKTKKGNSFSINSVKDIILNPLYIGKIRYNRFENWSEKRRRGKSENIILVDGNHEAIISLELWNKVHELQKKKSKTSAKSHQGSFLLTGLIKCPQCGSSMVASRTVNKLKDGTMKELKYYSCGAFRSKGSTVCSANSIRADYAESYVYASIQRVVNQPSILKDIVNKVNEKRSKSGNLIQSKLETIEKNIQKANSSKRKYFDLYEESIIDQDMLSERVQQLNTDLEKLLQEKSKMQNELSKDTEVELSYDYVKSLLANISNVLNKSSTDEQKLLYRLIIEEISINNEKKIESIQLNISEEIQNEIFKEPLSNDELDKGIFVFKNKKQPVRIHLVA